MTSNTPPHSPIDRLQAALDGRYRLDRELGAGGMATVYLAEDLKHDRKVAIKVLHEDLGATLGPERFLAEIKTTAKLQHPHILPLLDSGAAGGLLYYVMPFVEGESLRDRLTREKQLPLEDAVRIAREIADALGHAHAHGIVHRDIKPENVLLQGSHALVADFGIALAVQSAGGARMTQTGLSLGTPQYMSPEQAMGEKTLDARADIYALGAVTYEMLVGEPPFTGATVQAIVAKVLSSDPEPPTTMRKTVPQHVEDAVLTALAKLPADRFPDVKAFGAALGGGGTMAATRTHVSSRSGATPTRTRSWTAVGTALGVAVGLGLGWMLLRRDDAQLGVSREYLRQPADEALPNGTAEFVLSPDGNDLVYVGPGEQPGTTQLWRKRRDELHATRIAGTVGSRGPFFSPDGAWVAYMTSAGLMKIALAGGAPMTVVAGALGEDGHSAWMDDGRIVSTDRSRTSLVSADGGKPELILDASQIAGYNPHTIAALPGSHGLVVQACPSQCPRSVIYVLDFATKVPRMLVNDGRAPTWLSTGHLAYITSAGVLMVAPFDPKTLTFTGAAVPVLEHVSALSVSRAGRLLYREGAVGAAARPVWVDRTGAISVIDSSWLANISSFGLSRDGNRLAASVVDGSDQQIWIKDLPSGPLSKFTFDASNHFRPVWSADGKVLRFIRGDSTFGLFEKNTDGSGAVRPIRHEGHQIVEVTSSRDGAWLLMRTGGRDTTRLTFAMRPGVDTVARTVLAGTGGTQGLALSPDGRYVAYMNAASGLAEVYVSPFPDMASARWQISNAGGLEPRWSSDGHELFFVNMRNDLMVSRVAVTPTFSVLSSQRLFSVNEYVRDGGFHAYEPSADGTRFLMLRQDVRPGQLVQVDGWFAEVREKLNGSR